MNYFYRAAILFASIIMVWSICSFSLESNDIDSDFEIENRIPAFPGATGGGMYTTGGRGGKVIKVTNLNDSGPGSLRQAIKTRGPRTILFDVSGTIKLNSQLLITNGDLTIAGQSAPGDGICISGHEIRIAADNIIIRYLRFRLGDTSGKEYDAITGIGHQDIIIDHCSMSWSTDETVSFYNNQNFTLQWCLISESLNNSVHSKGAHGYGGIWGGKNASFVNNILAHHNSRNPRLQGARSHNQAELEKTELINNVIYNWGDKAIYGGENGRYNIVNNIFIPGPATNAANRDEIIEPYEPYGKFYLSGNTFIVDNNYIPAGWNHVSIPEKSLQETKINTPYPFDNPVTVDEPEMAYVNVLLGAGASHKRDAVDTRIIREISERTYTYGRSGIIDSQNETGGWPVLTACAPLKDSDGDGIPDQWEEKHGLNPLDSSDGNAFTLGPQYTNLEIYLNSIISNTPTIQKEN